MAGVPPVQVQGMARGTMATTRNLSEIFSRPAIADGAHSVAHAERQVLLSWLLISAVAAGIVAAILYVIASPGTAAVWQDRNWVLVAGIALLAVAWVINRAGHIETASALAIVTAAISVLTSMEPWDPSADRVSVSAYMMFAIVLSVLMLRLVWAIVATVCCSVAVALAPVAFGSTSLAPDALDHGVYIGALGTLLVVAAYHRNRVELARRAQLGASEQKYRFVAENVTDVLFVQSMDMRILYVSPSVEKFSGYTVAEVKTKDMRELMTPESCERAMGDFNRHAEEARKGQVADPLVEYEYVRKDGSRVWGELRMRLLMGPGSIPVGVQGVLRDITERRLAQDEQARLQEELRQSEKMRAIGQLAGGIAHDFNNQLTGIMACADMLRTSLSGDKSLRDLADMIVKTSERSSQLTHQLLSFARRGSTQSVPVDLHAILEEVVSILVHSIDKRIHITRNLRARQPVTLGDGGQIQNALLNVALNARDAMENGGELTFDTDTVSLDDAFCRHSSFGIAPGSYTRVCVSDTGCGMDGGTMQRIFEPFFTTKGPGKGVGMGLAMVHGTMYGHKGAVTVDSKPGQGTRVCLFLPVVSDELLAVVANKPRPLASRSLRLLLVDDEDLVLAATSRILRSEGHTVELARDGAAAVEAFSKGAGQYDVVMLDVVMPDKDGVSVYRELRASRPGARVLFCSGYSADARMRDLLADQHTAFLRKPFCAEDLLRALDELMGKAG